MHKPEAYNTVKIVSMFTKFSNMCLFKPGKKHAIRSSVYMVATGVDVRSEEAQAAILEWKMQWVNATFQTESALSTCSRVSEDQVRTILAEYGPQLISIATPVWRIQADGLRSAPFLQERNG
jgi:hypothetical protein